MHSNGENIKKFKTTKEERKRKKEKTKQKTKTGVLVTSTLIHILSFHDFCCLFVCLFNHMGLEKNPTGSRAGGQWEEVEKGGIRWE